MVWLLDAAEINSPAEQSQRQPGTSPPPAPPQAAATVTATMVDLGPTTSDATEIAAAVEGGELEGDGSEAAVSETSATAGANATAAPLGAHASDASVKGVTQLHGAMQQQVSGALGGLSRMAGGRGSKDEKK